MAKTRTQQTPSAAELRDIANEALRAEHVAREKACMAAVAAVLDEHRCVLVPSVTFLGVEIRPEIKVIAQD